MRFQMTLLLTLLTTYLASGQYSDGTIFKHKNSKEFRQHFKETPSNIEMVISQLNSDFTEKGRIYFKSLPEKIAVLQFDGPFYRLIFIWEMHKKNEVTYDIRKRNDQLVDYFIKNGSSGDGSEIIRLSIAALHRSLNNKSYIISELASKYGDSEYKNLIDSIRNASPGDTLFGQWYNEDKFFNRYSYSSWFEVVAKDEVTNNLKLKILKITIKERDVKQIKAGNRNWKVGDLLDWKNGDLRNWKEVITPQHSDSFPFQQGARVSPDGNLQMIINTREESDLQIRYMVRLTDNISTRQWTIVNCARRDLPKANF